MASSSDNISMAVFCDFENVALGVRDANYEKFDIKPVLERLLLKGSIVVKKSYCDWERYKGFKSAMHEANFELIEIPHVRQSGKNSADIRLVVDALDLCYTKSHVNTFVIISGDSDFSPLVSKLRENAKQVIGVGVKQSTSDLLVANCDEFIFYDDLVREQRRAAAKRDERKSAPQARRGNASDDRRKEELDARKAQALEMVVETFDALVSERGDTGKIWASLLKDTLKRRRPDFSETYYGFRTFGNLLEEAQSRGLFDIGRDEKSGTFVTRSALAPGVSVAEVLALESVEPVSADAQAEDAVTPEAPAAAAPSEASKGERGRGRGRGARKPTSRTESAAPVAAPEAVAPAMAEAQSEPQPAAPVEPVLAVSEGEPEEPVAAPKERRRTARIPAARKAAAPAPAVEVAAPVEVAEPVIETPATDAGASAEDKPARKKAARAAHKAPARKTTSRRPAKPKAPATGEGEG